MEWTKGEVMAAEFLCADTVGIPLFFDEKNKKIWGAERKSFSLGPWNLDVWMEVHSDHVENKEVSLWVSLTKNLWVYLIIGTKKTYMLVLDAKKLGITLQNYGTFNGLTPMGTAKKIKEGVKAVFEYKGSDERWVRLVKHMDYQQPE